jgi:predicted HAD superfamily Cof-like phosphohydrolase
MSTKTEKVPLIEKINAVKKFHDVFGISSLESPQGVIDEKDYILRYNLMKEENEEYLDACNRGDLIEIADALGDKMYILFGTILKHGLQYKIEEVFDEIHRSNMSKLDAEGNPIFREDGKIMKSDRYFRPDIKAVLEKKKSSV